MTVSAELQIPFVSRPILGVNVAVSSYDQVVRSSLLWAREGRSRALLFANVHVIMEAADDPAFLRQLNAADAINPDGVPLVWALRALGAKGAQRVCGPDATLALLAAAEEAAVPIGFYGGSPEVLGALIAAVRLRHPNLQIAFMESPPFRALTPEEDAVVVARINTSGARLLFVGLGCPKQEKWIIEHVGQVPAVMLAVGAAFDFIAGHKSRGPQWMHHYGLEWAYRLFSEPRRLTARYLKHNPRFVGKFLCQLLSGKI